MDGSTPLFDVVLHQPLIPNNTGNIGRTCVAVGAALRLIHPLGFSLDAKARRRAGLDYWPRLTLHEHDSWEAYQAQRSSPMWLFTVDAPRPFYEATFQRGDHLVFGSESTGLPDAVLQRHADRVLSLPMLPGERSLNLATVVCVALFEGIRQLRASGAVSVDAAGRLRP